MASYEINPLQGSLSNIDSIYCDGINIGLRDDPQHPDMAYIRSDEPMSVAAVFTSNRFQAAPLRHFLRYKEGFETNFLLVNAKNANAMTGEAGISDIDEIFDALGARCKLHNPIMSSTGVIGYRLNTQAFKSAFETIDLNQSNSSNAARAIMTTDRFQKELCYEVTHSDGSSYKIAAICKGAGMIDPAMATMLCFIVTDVEIPKDLQKPLLTHAIEQSFNAISVDGDTSTNDTVMLFSTKEKKNFNKESFQEVLNRLTKELAFMILDDAEGGTKRVAFRVKGAKNDAEAKKAAVMLSNSLLVKTALFGEDPNWGRIASTIGSSGIECYEDRLKIHYDDLLIYSDESRELSSSTEAQAHKIMSQKSFEILCDIGIGKGEYCAYGCDLTYDYVKINAEYRT